MAIAPSDFDSLAAPIAPGRPGLKWPLILTALGILLIFPCGLLRDFWIHNEGRRALVAYEMYARHDWLVPRLMGEPLLTKPPLFYWLEMISYKIFGVSDRAARVPSMILAVMSIVVVYRTLNRLLRDRAAAAFAALAMATMPIFVYIGAYAEPEMAFLAFSIFAMDAFTAAMLSDVPRPGAYWRGWLWLALSFLVKGPLIPGAFGGALVLWHFLRRREPTANKSRPAKATLRFIAGVLIVLAPTAIWYGIIVISGQPLMAMLHEVQSHLEGDAPHTEPFKYYFSGIDEFCFPWITVLGLAAIDGIVAAWRRGGRGPTGALRAAWEYLLAGRGERLLLVLWFSITILIYSVIPSKRFYYAIGLTPPLAGLLAMAFCDWRPSLAREWRSNAARAHLRNAAILAALAALFLVVGLFKNRPSEWNIYSGEDKLDSKVLIFIWAAWFAGAAIVAYRTRSNTSNNPAGLSRVTRQLLAWTAAVMTGSVLVYTFGIHRVIDKQLTYRRAADELAAAIREASAGSPTPPALYSVQTNNTICFYLRRYDIPLLDDTAAIKKFTAEHPGALGITVNKTLDLVDAAGPYETLYRSSWLKSNSSQILLVRLKPR